MIVKEDSFQNRFCKALEIRNMKCSELSKATGIRESTLSQYKSGYAEPKSQKLGIIAQALNVDPVWLMGLDVPMDSRTARLTEYAKRLGNLSQDKQKEVFNFIDFLENKNDN